MAVILMMMTNYHLKLVTPNARMAITVVEAKMFSLCIWVGKHFKILSILRITRRT